MRRLIAAATPDRLAVVLGLTILILSVLPTAGLMPAQGYDNLQHFLAYGLLSFLGFLRCERIGDWLARAAAILGLGAGIELTQPFFNRLFGWADLASNTAGAIAGAALVLIVRRAWRDGWADVPFLHRMRAATRASPKPKARNLNNR